MRSARGLTPEQWVIHKLKWGGKCAGCLQKNVEGHEYFKDGLHHDSTRAWEVPCIDSDKCKAQIGQPCVGLMNKCDSDFAVHWVRLDLWTQVQEQLEDGKLLTRGEEAAR